LRGLSGENARLVEEMWSRGAKLREIAEALGVSVSTVHKYARKLGLQPKFKRRIKSAGEMEGVLRQVAELHSRGLSPGEIARQTGYSTIRVKQFLRMLRVRAEAEPSDELKLKQVAELWGSGLKVREIAERLGLSTSSVYFYLSVAGLRRGSGPRKMSEEKMRQAVELWKSGVTLREIARRVGVSVSTLTRHLRAANLRRKRKAVISNRVLSQIARMHASGATAREIAGKLGLHVATVRKKLKALGLAKGGSAKTVGEGELKVMAELFHSGLTLREIASRLGVSVDAVKYRLKKLGLRRGSQVKVNEEVLRRMEELWHKGTKIKDIASQLGLSKKTVSDYLKKLGLRRQVGGRRKVGEEELKVMVELWHKGASIGEIARRLGLDKSTVSKRLCSMGLRRREHRRCPNVGSEELLELVKKGLSDAEIAVVYKTTERCVAKLRHKYGIDRRKMKRSAAEQRYREKAGMVMEMLSEKCYTTSGELAGLGVKLNRRLLEKLRELSDKVRWFRITYRSTPKYTILPPKLQGKWLLYLAGCEPAVATFIVLNMVSLDVPHYSVARLLENNGAPKELVGEVRRTLELVDRLRSEPSLAGVAELLKQIEGENSHRTGSAEYP